MDACLSDAVQLLTNARRPAILSGAGVSKESGIPTFREAQTGLWAQYDPQELATPQAFRDDPALVWRWYRFRRDLISQAQPNAGHLALAELERTFPRLVILTQNVDGLHQTAGSSDVVELHGNIWRARCFAACQPHAAPVVAVDAMADPLPHCPYCGGLMRPDVVWFGEPLPAAALQRAYQVSSECDLMLVVGTSGVVFPAALLPAVARDAGARVIEVNPAPSEITLLTDLFLQGPAGVILPELVSRVG